MVEEKGGDFMYEVTKIADWFLAYNDFMKTNQGADGISHLKLQKLLYYAQSAFLALKDEPLFPNDIIAWNHGPVVEEIYHKYKKYGSNDIDEFSEVKIDAETEKVLTEVYNVFGEYSAWGLRNLTHTEAPWCNTSRNGVILQELMKESFKENYVQ